MPWDEEKSRVAIQKWCKRLGVPKLGPQYMIDDAALDRIRRESQPGPGRPWHKERTE